MLNFVLRRVLWSIPVLLIATFLLFCFVRVTFDPTARLRTSRDTEVIQREKERLGLDKPLYTQYTEWLGNAVTGDFGQGDINRRPVAPQIQSALWYTIQLIFWGILISTIVAVSIGVYSAVRQYSVLDYTFTGLSFIGLAMPPFWFGLIAIQFLAVRSQEVFGLDSQPLFFVGLHSVGESGFNWDYVQHLILPVMTLTVQIIASWSRYQRASMLDAMSADYIRTARAKGVPRRKVVFKHGLRNALIPLITIMALDIGALFGGLVVTETIFSIPGMGRLFITAFAAGDATTLVGWTAVTAAFIITFNLLADVMYGFLDPRIRYS